jgi:putative PIN family toxin of toxin-antitoxin system
VPVVLLDTNIWVSTLINPRGFPGRIISAWLDRQFTVVVSMPLLEELADVLTRPRIQAKYHLTSADVDELLQLIDERAVHIHVIGKYNICRDPDDDLVLETAIEGKANYLISRDDDLKRDVDLIQHMKAHGVEVLSVQQFLDLLTQTS